MLNEHAKYRRFAELMWLLSYIQEKIIRINFDKIFFQDLINRIPMKNILYSMTRHFSTFIP